MQIYSNNKNESCHKNLIPKHYLSPYFCYIII